jgi:hypothetical protein
MEVGTPAFMRGRLLPSCELAGAIQSYWYGATSAMPATGRHVTWAVSLTIIISGTLPLSKSVLLDTNLLIYALKIPYLRKKRSDGKFTQDEPGQSRY